MEKILIILLGLIFGSFLNVVIYRLPLKIDIVKPRSYCPNCNTIIKFYNNIPVISYIILRGKCKNCKKKISLLYPLVEIFTAFSFWFAFQYTGNFSVHTIFIIIFLCVLISLALIDLKHMILPDELTIGGASLFLLYSFFNPELSFIEAFCTAFGSALVFAGIYFFYLKFRKIEGLGMGDIKMMLLLGAFLGFKRLIVSILIASLSGVLVGSYFILFKKKSMKFALPFGTFLGFGSYISLFFGYKILKIIQSIYI